MSHAFLRRSRMLVGALAVVGASSLALASGASAKTFNVSNTEQFVKAVTEANGDLEANTIVVAGGSYLPEATVTFKNKSGLQTIEGPASAPPARLLGSGVLPFPSELFVIEAGVSVTFKKVDIATGGGLGTPAVLNSGTLGLEASTVSGNPGAGILQNSGTTLSATNSTISDGSEFGVINAGGTASFSNSTVAFNKSGGIESTGTLNLTNTIVAENTGSGDCVTPATTSDHSLDSDGKCGVGTLSKTNPLLQKELLLDGGSTVLHSLKPGSPAIDAGNEATCTKISQEGNARPDTAAEPCDIGADEFNETPPTIKVPANITTPATSSAGAVVTYSAEATSSDDAIRSFGCTPESGSNFPIGTTTVTCTAIDGHETTANSSFTVTVVPLPPTTVTAPASAITQTSATVNATVNPNGGAVTDCHFEYGTTTTYGTSVLCSSLPGSGGSPVAVSQAIAGLTASTTYHFRISATNAGGTELGGDETFFTAPPPASPPHYFANASKLKESAGKFGEAGVKEVIGWGTVELKGEKGAAAPGAVKCHEVSGGSVSNPVGGGAGEGATQAFVVFDCESNLCKEAATASVVPEKLPWLGTLAEGGTQAVPFRARTAGIKMDVTCAGASAAHFKGEDTPLAPAGEDKGTTPGHPGFLLFGAGSGELEEEEHPGSSKTNGALKVLGYTEQELIQVK